MRISARLDPDHAEKLEFLASATRQGKTELLKAAIDVYYRQVVTSHRRPAEALQESGFVGCATGPADLSEHYKKDLLESLSGKHDHR